MTSYVELHCVINITNTIISTVTKDETPLKEKAPPLPKCTSSCCLVFEAHLMFDSTTVRAFVAVILIASVKLAVLVKFLSCKNEYN